MTSRALIAAAVLLLSACDPGPTIELSVNAWRCTAQRTEKYLRPQPTGKTVIMIPDVRTVCSQWSKM